MTAAKSSDSSRSPAIKLQGARKGPIANGLAKSLTIARRAKSVPADSVVATLAERMALIADEAWRVSDLKAFQAATTRLLILCRSLGLTDLSLGGGGTSDGDDEPDPIDAELAKLLGSGPTLRNR